MYKHKIFRITALLLVLTQTLPAFNMLIPLGEALKFAFFTAVSILFFPSLLGKKSIIALIVYGIVCFSFYKFGNRFFEDINSAVIEPFVMVSALIIAEYTLKYDKDYKFTKYIVLSVFIENIITSIITVPLLELNPNLIRMTTAGEGMGDKSPIFSVIMQYQTIHGLPFLIAPIVFLCRKVFRRGRIYAFLWGTSGLILFYIIFRSNAATSFLVSTLMLFMGFMFTMETMSQKVFFRLVLVITVAMVLLQPAVIEPILSATQSVMDPNGAGYKRIGEITESVKYGSSDGDLESRQNLYSDSFSLFLGSPLWGTATPEKIGKHAWIIDRLALFGIIFVMPLVLLFLYHFKGFYKNLIHTKVIYVCGFASMILMLTIKNSFNQGSWMYGFAYLPLFCRFIDYTIDNKLLTQTKSKYKKQSAIKL